MKDYIYLASSGVWIDRLEDVLEVGSVLLFCVFVSLVSFLVFIETFAAK